MLTFTYVTIMKTNKKPKYYTTSVPLFFCRCLNFNTRGREKGRKFGHKRTYVVISKKFISP